LQDLQARRACVRRQGGESVMKAKQIHEMKDDELVQKLSELKQELFNLRFSNATGQLNNPMQMVVCKRDIARIKTVLRQRELAKKA
jgi:large subunit ribosomal protein L29